MQEYRIENVFDGEVKLNDQNQHHDFDFDLFLNKDSDSGKPLNVHADVGLEVTISGSIPNQTTMMFVLSDTGEIKRQYTYGLSHNLKNQPPDVK